MPIERLEEFAIPSPIHESIVELLQRCFPDYPPRQSFLHQCPDFRYLLWKEELLAGHLAIEHRWINVGGEVANIFGIADFCIHPDYQDQGFGRQLLAETEKLARSAKIDFLVLIASDHEFYQKQGFRCIDNLCRWVMIHQGRSIGINQRKLPDSILVKQLGRRTWGTGIFDFMGHIF